MITPPVANALPSPKPAIRRGIVPIERVAADLPGSLVNLIRGKTEKTDRLLWVDYSLSPIRTADIHRSTGWLEEPPAGVGCWLERESI